MPFIDRVRPLIDMREQVVSFPPQPVITEDNLVVSIDTVVYFQVTDARAATYEIANYLGAVEQLTTTTLRNVVGGLNLEEALTSRDNINGQLRVVLDEATGKWGIRVGRVELKAIDPPLSIQDSMEKQMRAERDRRALILTAEGTKQSAILTAEGARQAAILAAEGDAQAAVLRAQGEAEAITTVFGAIHAGDPDGEAARLPVPADAARRSPRAPRTSCGSSRSELTEALKGMSAGFLGGAGGKAHCRQVAAVAAIFAPARPRVLAHRGLAVDAPENTLLAFAAASRGCRLIETDVHASADGVAVDRHDPDLTRVAGRAERVDSAHPWQSLRRSIWGMSRASARSPRRSILSRHSIQHRHEGRGRRRADGGCDPRGQRIEPGAPDLVQRQDGGSLLCSIARSGDIGVGGRSFATALVAARSACRSPRCASSARGRCRSGARARARPARHTRRMIAPCTRRASRCTSGRSTTPLRMRRTARPRCRRPRHRSRRPGSEGRRTAAVSSRMTFAVNCL